MNFYKKIFTMFKGGSREIAEAVVDANGLRIFEQEIYDCEVSMNRAKHDLSKVIAEGVRLSREIKHAESQLVTKEEQALKAMEMENDVLVHEIADFIAKLEETLTEQKKARDSILSQQKQIEASLTKAAKEIESYRRELRLVQAKSLTQKTTKALAGNANAIGSRIGDMRESLSRIKANQENFDDWTKSLESLEENFGKEALEKKIEAAGISKTGRSAQEVIARLKVKNIKTLDYCEPIPG